MKQTGDARHLALGDVGSTNSECMERARAGDPGGLWITADRQLGGRGRRGRNWVSEPGNLYASLLLVDVAEPAALASLPLAVAVAVHETVRQVLPPDAGRAAIKWPNDVLVDGAKIAGILIESEVLADGRRAIVIGCGINVAHHPEGGLYRATALHAEGAAVSPPDLFARLFVSMDWALSVWDGGRGLAETRAEWLRRAGGLGGPVTVRLPEREIRGFFENIDPEGRLMLRAEDGVRHAIAAGDVFFPELTQRKEGSR